MSGARGSSAACDLEWQARCPAAPGDDESAAEEAHRSLGVEIPRPAARQRIFEILAGWALEAVRTLGIIEFEDWPPSKAEP
ncbi:MAG: hypothetical protein QXU91_08490 [Thermofilum sp.]